MDESPDKPFDFTAEFVRHHRSLWLVAMSIVENSADADDVLQEGAIVGIRKLQSFRPGTSFRAWMGEIVRNVALNRRRSVRREVHRFGYLDAQHVETPWRPPTNSPLAADGSLVALQESLDDRMLKALMELEPTARACMLLRCIEGLESAEIAVLLDIPKGTAMSHVFRCRRVLADRLSAPADESPSRSESF